jgi:hypothetical protein
VKSLHSFIQGVIENGQQLHYRMELLSEDLIIDEEALVAPLPEAPRPPTPVETAKSDAFTVDQLDALRVQVQQLAAGSPTASAQEMASLLARLAASAENVPAAWAGASAEKLQQAFFPSQDVDVCSLLASLGLQTLPSATAADLSELKKSLVHADDDQDGKVTAEEFKSARFWFQEMETPDDAYPKADRMKDFLFAALSVDGLLGIDDALLYLCFDADAALGLRKAFAVFGYAQDGYAVTAADMDQIFHHGATAGTKSAPFAKSGDCLGPPAAFKHP